jgi:L-amino acid N-acyltransferase YncA
MVQPISIRSNYKNVWELSIYINKNKRNNQIALNLYRDILQQMPKQKAQYLCALVFENNTRSMELLQYSGFRTFIELKEAAEMADQEFYQMNLLMNKLN